MAFSDTFTDTSGTILTSHTPDSGGSWSAGSGTQTTDRPRITDANRLRTEEGGIDLVRCSFTPASADYDVQATFRHISGSNFFGGVCGRYAAAAQTFYLLELDFDNDQVILQSCVAGSYSGALDSAAATLNTATDYTIKLEMRGTTIKGYLDGVEVVSITNSDVTAAGGAGLQFYGDNGMTNATGVHADNFSATDVSSGTPYTIVADPGIFEFGGTDATLTFDEDAIEYTLTAEAGSFDMVGTVASFVQTVAASPGSFAFTGTDATLSYQQADGDVYSITADPGAFSFVGVDATLTYTRSVDEHEVVAEAGAFAFVGTAATLSWSGAPAPEEPDPALVRRVHLRIGVGL